MISIWLHQLSIQNFFGYSEDLPVVWILISLHRIGEGVVGWGGGTGVK